MDVFLRELAEAAIERIEDRLGRIAAWISAAVIVLLLTAGAIIVGALVFT